MSNDQANAKVLATLGGDIDDQAACAWYESNEAKMNVAVKEVRMENTVDAVSKLLEGLGAEEKQKILGKVATSGNDIIPPLARGA